MFRSALVRLTGIYLLILMVVSMFFSIALYRISTHEVNNRLRRQVDFVNNNAPTIFGRPGYDPDGPNPFETEREQELAISREHVIDQLIYANVLIFICGGIGSYMLARRTLHPIEEAHEAQLRFTADASHELRTPLAAMRAETEVALRNRKLTAQEARELLQSNLEELGRLTDLSESLLQLARGADDVSHHQSIDLKTVVTRAIKQTEPLAGVKAIAIKQSPAPTITVTGDASQLTQALVILLDNAIKYSEPGTAINVSLTHDKPGAHLSVADHGRGIQDTDLPHIFDRFYRADNARSQANVGGHGLGLSIAQQIIDLHGGSIDVKSTLGKGSRFTINLPSAR